MSTFRKNTSCLDIEHARWSPGEKNLFHGKDRLTQKKFHDNLVPLLLRLALFIHSWLKSTDNIIMNKVVQCLVIWPPFNSGFCVFVESSIYPIEILIGSIELQVMLTLQLTHSHSVYIPSSMSQCRSRQAIYLEMVKHRCDVFYGPSRVVSTVIDLVSRGCILSILLVMITISAAGWCITGSLIHPLHQNSLACDFVSLETSPHLTLLMPSWKFMLFLSPPPLNGESGCPQVVTMPTSSRLSKDITRETRTSHTHAKFPCTSVAQYHHMLKQKKHF